MALIQKIYTEIELETPTGACYEGRQLHYLGQPLWMNHGCHPEGIHLVAFEVEVVYDVYQVGERVSWWDSEWDNKGVCVPKNSGVCVCCV